MSNSKETGADRASSVGGNSQARLARRLVEELRHRADLALFSDSAPSRWTDALLAETRFHLSGTMNAMEMAIRLEISDRDVDAELSRLAQPYCGPALERQVDLLSPELLSHFRLRGALSVVQRERLGPAMSGQSDDLLSNSGEGAFAQALAALALAEQRWGGPLLLDTPLRPDLPAEYFCDLAWTAAALLIRGLSQASGETDHAAVESIIQAVEHVIARHDEGTGPFALAERCARALSSDERLRIAPMALIERRLLLFCAMVEAETALPIDQVLGALIDGGDEARQAVLKLMGIDEALAVHVFEILAPLTVGTGERDIALTRFIERYRDLDPGQVETWLARMLMPQALAAKLSMIDPLG